MAIFDNVYPEKFLLLQINYQMILEASGSIDMRDKIQYLHIFHVEKLYTNLKPYVEILVNII